MNKQTNTRIYRRVTSVGILCIVLLGSVFFLGCRPARWDHVTIQEVNARGETVKEWKGARVEMARAGWVRFKTPDGQLIVIQTPHRMIYE